MPQGPLRVTSPVGSPKYQQLHDVLVSDIQRLPEGSPLPTERELAERYSVSRSTVRLALGQLLREQRVTRRQGKGTFVARHKIVQSLELTSHTEGMRSQGIVPGSKLLDVRRVSAAADVSAALRVAPDAEVLRLERLRLADGDPIAIETVYLDATRFDGITAALLEDQSLYRLLSSDYDVTLASAEETIEVSLAGEREAALLNVWVGAPLLMFSRCSIDVRGAPVEYVCSLYRGDRFQFKTRLEPPGSVRREAVPDVRLRTARREDAGSLARVFIDAWRGSYRGVVDEDILDALDANAVTEWLGRLVVTGPQRTVLAEDSRGEVEGFVRFGDDVDDPRSGHIAALYVSPQRAGRGVGTRLLRYAIAELVSAGPRSITLWVFEKNGAARQFYGGLGFEPDGSRRVEQEYRADEIRLVRRATFDDVSRASTSVARG
ncbi:MAG: GNAT family N-acetyltransferase [Acidimicrobiales bacterium]